LAEESSYKPDSSGLNSGENHFDKVL
jgi:hypothetical protein